MKFTGLVFDYDTKKMSDNIGRKWAPKVYGNKESIFSYSAASIASVLKYNDHIEYRVYTDDVDHLKKEILKYNVQTDSLVLVNWKDQLNDWKSHRYSFYPLLMFLKTNDFYGKEDFVKLDNDLTALKPWDIKNIKDSECISWKYERLVSEGDVRWGEILVCNTILKTTQFPIYNLGTLGLSKNNHHIIKDSLDLAIQLTEVNILEVTDVNSPIYHVCDQTAYNWNFFKNKLKVVETYQYFNHHFDNKWQCVIDSNHLLKV